MGRLGALLHFISGASVSKAILAVLVLACCPVLAQNITLAINASTARTHSVSRATAIPDNSAEYNYGSASLPSFGLEASWSFLKLPVGALAVTGLYEPQAQKNLDEHFKRSTIIGPLPAATTTLRYRRSVAGIGIRWEGSTLLEWSLGMSYRNESIKMENGFEFPGADANNASVSATVWRPWIQGRLGTAFPGIGLKPFLAMTFAKAVGSTTAGSAFDTNLAKHLAPDSELGAEVGIRF
jgi:hypothetical protein